MEVPRQHVDVAVKDNPYDIPFRIDYRRSRVAADDIGGAYRVERCGQVKLGRSLRLRGPVADYLIPTKPFTESKSLKES